MQSVYCEPYCIESGNPFEIHRVSYQTDEPYSCLMHFHEVHEFIIFDEIDGSYYNNQGQSKLQQNDIVFTPALEVHDFDVTAHAKSWHIVQLMPEYFQKEGLMECESIFQQGLHLRLPKEQTENIRQQVKWLMESYQQDPLSDKSLTLLKLLVLWIAEHAKPVVATNVVSINHSANIRKLMPVLEAFRQDAAVELTMVEAANLCHISPSHFSRQFKKVFRSSFSEYALRHKLYVAARQLSMRNRTVTDISYDLNFSSPSHFIAQFKRQFGTTPLQFQKDVIAR